jgi:signal transduction histidine kinase
MQLCPYTLRYLKSARNCPTISDGYDMELRKKVFMRHQLVYFQSHQDRLNLTFKVFRHIIPCALLVLFIVASIPLRAQDKDVIQVKVFDEQQNPLPNVTLSINGKEFISIGNKGMAFTEIPGSELPPKSVKIKGNKMEAVSWDYKKGVLEIILRNKSFTQTTVIVKNEGNEPLSNVRVKFQGKRAFSTKTNAQGIFEIPLSVNEKITGKDQFNIKGHIILKLLLQDKENIIIAEPLKNKSDTTGVETAMADNRLFKNFDLKNIDSIQSLTVFYAVFKNYQIETLDEEVKRKIDSKFNVLISQLGDSAARTLPAFFIGRISDSSLVVNDVQNLAAQAGEEGKMLDGLRQEFDEKIQLMTGKIDRQANILNDSTRAALLNDIEDLEKILNENENKFYQNHAYYRQILSSLKERLFDIHDLKNKLIISESQRLEEQKIFQQKMQIVLLVSLGLGLLALILTYFGVKLSKKKKELINANQEIKRINEELEVIIRQRTKSLEEANHEMDVFLYKASHDLRRPICSIMGLYHVARLTVDHEGMDLFERTFHTAKSMDRMLRKLQLINEINHPTDHSLLSFNDTISGIREKFNKFIRERNISFVTDFPDDLSFYSYPALVEIILGNLLENALFYSALKKQPNPEVRFSAQRKNDSVEISVYDNGVGIAPAIHDKLWEMFFVGNENSTGNGIGLYLVRKSVEALKGRISFESEQYVFTRFVVTIPLPA